MRERCEFPPMTSPRLTAEQRLALAMLATAGRNGNATTAPPTTHGFSVNIIAGLGQLRAGEADARAGSALAARRSMPEKCGSRTLARTRSGKAAPK